MQTIRSLIDDTTKLRSLRAAKSCNCGTCKACMARSVKAGGPGSGRHPEGGGQKVLLQNIRSELKNMRVSDMTKAERNIMYHLNNGALSKSEKVSRIGSELKGIDKADMTQAESNITRHLGR